MVAIKWPKHIAKQKRYKFIQYTYTGIVLTEPIINNK
jgi:hypothetical protein